jgi:hypothetical protein
MSAISIAIRSVYRPALKIALFGMASPPLSREAVFIVKTKFRGAQEVFSNGTARIDVRDFATHATYRNSQALYINILCTVTHNDVAVYWPNGHAVNFLLTPLLTVYAMMTYQ